MDDGESWSVLKESKPVSSENLVAWPSNGSHGVQLASGRLVIGGFIAEVKPEGESYLECEYAAGVLYSNDHRKTWHIGARTPYNGSDEIAVIELANGKVYKNFRLNNRNPRDLVRGYARSRDGGENFYEVGLHDNLSKMGCHVGLVRLFTVNDNGRNAILFSGPYGGGNPMTSGHDRNHLMLRASFDEGYTWPIAQILDPGYAGYSDLAVTEEKTILCIHEKDSFEKGKTKVKIIRLSWYAVENVYESRLRNLN